MCTLVVINRGEQEISTPRQFEDYFNLNTYIVDEDKDMCLCHVDIEHLFFKNEIPYKYRDGDYYVGQLNQIE